MGVSFCYGNCLYLRLLREAQTRPGSEQIRRCKKEKSVACGSKGASPKCGFLSFRPVEFFEQSSYSSLELRLNVEPLLHHALD
jgi:hypothetical protein